MLQHLKKYTPNNEFDSIVAQSIWFILDYIS